MKKMAAPRGFYFGPTGKVHPETVSLALINAAKMDVISKGSEVCVVCLSNGTCPHYKEDKVPSVCSNENARINTVELKRISDETLEARQEKFGQSGRMR